MTCPLCEDGYYCDVHDRPDDTPPMLFDAWWEKAPTPRIGEADVDKVLMRDLRLMVDRYGLKGVRKSLDIIERNPRL